MTKLHIFDMDGTILEGSACLHLSDHLGCLDELNVIEEAWGRGEVGHVEFYELCLPLWQELDAPGVASVFANSPWRRNVEKVFKDIAARGEHSAVITLSPLFFVDGLKAWGATTTHGADIGPGRVLDPALVLTPDGKVEIAETLIRQYGIGREDVIAYGDSASDIPLFQTLSHTVAVNGSERLRALAAASERPSV
jgi:phosphoserine phosphatase